MIGIDLTAFEIIARKGNETEELVKIAVDKSLVIDVDIIDTKVISKGDQEALKVKNLEKVFFKNKFLAIKL